MEGPECVVCLQVFDEGEHTPRVFSCGHSVCQSCVAELRSHWGGGSDSKGGHVGSGLVRCPECKQQTKIPLGGFLELPKNIELMRLMQGVPKTRIASKSGEVYAEEVKKTLAKKEQDRDSTSPFPLSEVIYGEPVIWILPQAAIKRRKDLVDGLCVGYMTFCDKKSQSKVQQVSLQILSTIDPRGHNLRYKELICSAWETLNPKTRAKLKRFLALGCHCNYFAEVAGLWMSGEGVLFLVSKVHGEGMTQARRLLSSDHGTAEGKGRSCETLKEDPTARTLIRLGVELCELLMEIHTAGLVVGTLRVDCFSLDAYGHLRLQAGKCIFWTRDNSRYDECFSPEVLETIKESDDTGVESSAVHCEVVSQNADVWSLGCLLLGLLSGSRDGKGWDAVLEQKARFKEQLLNCMAAVPSDRPRVVDLWRELKELLDDQAPEIPSHSLEASSEDNLDICNSGRRITPADDNNSEFIEPETASEERDIDPQTEATTDAPSLPGALLDAEVTILQGHQDTVSCLCVCGSYLISASFDKTLRIWSLDDYRMVQTLKGHEQRITALVVHEASELCVSGDYAGNICAWNLASTDDDDASPPVATWQEHQDWRYSGVASLAISGDELLYSGSGDRTIKGWSTSDFKQVARMEGHKGVVSVLMVEGQVLFSGSWDGTIRLWWRPDHSPLASFGGGSSEMPLGGIRALVKCPASGLLFSGHDSGVIQIWNEEVCVGAFKAHTGVLSALTCDQDWLYSSSWDGFVKAWPLEVILSGGSIPVERKGNQAAVTALSYGQQGKLFVGTAQYIQVYSQS